MTFVGVLSCSYGTEPSDTEPSNMILTGSGTQPPGVGFSVGTGTLTDDGMLTVGNLTGTSTGPDLEEESTGEEIESSKNPWDRPRFDLGSLPDTACVSDEPEYQFSDIWVANTEVGTVTKIDTNDGLVIGRYRSSEHTHDANTLGGDSPSRTSVSQFGDSVVANRGPISSVTAFASMPHRCVDRNLDGVIQTSSGKGDVLDWGEDECFLWTYTTPADWTHGVRAVAWEGGEWNPNTCEWSVPNPRVWLAYWGEGEILEVRRLAGDTGEELDSLTLPLPSIPYGGATDIEGNFWFLGRNAYGAGGPSVLIKVGDDLDYDSFRLPAGQNGYGMGLDRTGDPWIAGWGDRILHFDRITNQFIDSGGSGVYRGLQVDFSGRAWAVGNKPCRLAVFDVDTNTLIRDDIPLLDCIRPVGVSFDHEGFVWVVDLDASRVYKINPEPPYNEILRIDNMYKPYTYSDMTGNGLNLVTNPEG